MPETTIAWRPENRTEPMFPEPDESGIVDPALDIEHISKASSLIIILLFSLVGNGLILVIILKHSQMRTVINAFVCSLSSSDLLVTLFCMPLIFTESVVQHWPFGEVVCALHHYVTSASAVFTSLNMVFIATDRYVAVVRPSHLKIRGRLAAIFIIIAWLVALVVSVPWDVKLEHMNLIIDPETGKQTLVCRNFLPPPTGNEIYRYIVTITLGHVLPLMCNLYCLVIISSKVYSVHVKIRPSVVPLSHLLFQSEMRTATTVIIMISLYVLCWLPYILFTILSCISTLYLPEVWYDLAIWLTWLNKAVNPTIYALRNKTVSQYFTLCVCCFRRRKIRRPDIYKWTEQRPRATSIVSENRLQPYSPNIFFARSSVDSDIALTSASGDMRQSSFY